MKSAVSCDVNDFGGRHADFRARVRHQRPGGLARDHGTDHVADGQRLRALLLGLALRRQSIRGFARLRNHDGQDLLREMGSRYRNSLP